MLIKKPRLLCLRLNLSEPFFVIQQYIHGGVIFKSAIVDRLECPQSWSYLQLILANKVEKLIFFICLLPVIKPMMWFKKR